MPRLELWSLGLMRDAALARRLCAFGIEPCPPFARGADGVLVWGRDGRAARRGMAAARRRQMPVWTVEDAPLRGLDGRSAPLGLVIDAGGGLHTDRRGPSALSALLDAGAPPPPDARGLMELLAQYRLSKYNLWDDSAPPLPEGAVLLCDQLRGDASIAGAGATAESFARMLGAARAAHPEANIVIRTHPRGGGHFEPGALPPGVTLRAARSNPWDDLARAGAVYAVSSQLGFEAMMAGHAPQLFGRPFYAHPAGPVAVFGALYQRHARWFDASRDEECDLARAITLLDGEVRAARATRGIRRVAGVRAWKRRAVSCFFRPGARPRFVARAERADAAWARAAEGARVGRISRIEDGFIRSQGLGARLVPPLSLVFDRTGIHSDATRPSGLEAILRETPALGSAARARSAALRREIVARGVTKYATTGAPDAHRPQGASLVLVPGQVSDDASLRNGLPLVDGNAGLLAAARRLHPGARIAWRAHPDAVAGLRDGLLPRDTIARHADEDLTGAPLEAVWPRVAEIVTLTSTLGFEAVLRGLPVTCLGWPFYAGWGLTRDLAAPLPEGRRAIALDLDELVHGVLIEGAVYCDPVRRVPCAPEVLVERLATGAANQRIRGPILRLLARGQDRLAGHAALWR